MADKRLNYFKGEFLRAQDFQDEQSYHLNNYRVHCKHQHTWGVIAGLEVLKKEPRKLSVRPGRALDGEGRTIFLENDREIELAGFTVKTLYVTVSYQEKLTDAVTIANANQFTRITGEPEINAREKKPDHPETELLLAVVSLNDDHTINTIDQGCRRFAGVVGGDLVAQSVTFPVGDQEINIKGESFGKDTKLRVAAAVADFSGWLITGGNLGVGTPNPQAKLAVNGGLHVGGDSDPGDNNLWVDGDCVVNGNSAINGNSAVNGNSVVNGGLEVKGAVRLTDSSLDVLGPLGVITKQGNQLVWLMKPGESLEPGDVVALDEKLQVKKTTDPKTALVYGIIIGKEQAAVIIGDPKDKDLIAVARIGIVKAKVARTNPITFGSCLKISTDKPGHLFQPLQEDKTDSIAVALESLPADAKTGLISVLLRLY